MLHRWLVLLVAISGELIGAQQSRRVEITKEITFQPPARWHVAPKRFTNVVEITTGHTSTPGSSCTDVSHN